MPLYRWKRQVRLIAIAAVFATLISALFAEGVALSHQRHSRGKVHPLEGVLSLTVLALMCGQRSAVSKLPCVRCSLDFYNSVESVQYAVTSLPSLSPKRALTLLQGHWGIENSLFHVKDDSFGEDRRVLQHHRSGAVLSLLTNAAVTLLRGDCPLWSSSEPLTGRAQRPGVQPALLPSTPGLVKS